MCKIQMKFNSEAEREAYLNGYELAKKMFKRSQGEEPSTATFEPYEDNDYSGGGYLMCTKCKWAFSFGAYRILQDDNYCPHCGAKIMKEGEAE